MNENLTDERFENLMEMFENIPNDINIPKEYAKHEINDVYHNYEFIPNNVLFSFSGNKLSFSFSISEGLNKM